MIFVCFEKFFEDAKHFLAITGSEGFGHAVEEVGIFGEFLQAFLEGFSGESVIVFGEREVADGEINFAEVGIGFLDGGVEIIQDEFGICAENDGGFAEGDNID